MFCMHLFFHVIHVVGYPSPQHHFVPFWSDEWCSMTLDGGLRFQTRSNLWEHNFFLISPCTHNHTPNNKTLFIPSPTFPLWKMFLTLVLPCHNFRNVQPHPDPQALLGIQNGGVEVGYEKILANSRSCH